MDYANILYLVCLSFQKSKELDIISIIKGINNLDHQLQKENDRYINTKLFYEYGTDQIAPTFYSINNLQFRLLKHNLIIKRFNTKNKYFSGMFCAKEHLNHPNLVNIYICFSQFVDSERVDWYIMENFERKIQRFCNLEEAQIKNICRDVCYGLQYLHDARNIVHMDISTFSVVGVRKKSQSVFTYDTIQVIYEQLQAYNKKTRFELLFNIEKFNYDIDNRNVSAISAIDKHDRNFSNQIQILKTPIFGYVSNIANFVQSNVIKSFEYLKNINYNINRLYNNVKRYFSEGNKTYLLKILLIHSNIENTSYHDLVIVLADNNYWVCEKVKLKNEFLNSLVPYENNIRDQENILNDLSDLTSKKDDFLLFQQFAKQVTKKYCNQYSDRKIYCDKMDNISKDIIFRELKIRKDAIFTDVIHIESFSIANLRTLVCDFEYKFVIIDLDYSKIRGISSTSYEEFTGTFGFCSPEIFYSIQADFQTDIWSFGILAYKYFDEKFFEFIDNLEDEALVYNKIYSVFYSHKSSHISDTFFDFLRICFRCKPINKPTVDFLLQHEFLKDK
ncbi:Myosin light chain kinase [Conglomerata obtusa]